MKLSEIYERFKGDKGHGDKGTTHSYIRVYERLLGPYRECASVCEIGVERGLSVQMWAEYFPKALIHGVDLKEVELDHPRIITYAMNATKSVPNVSFDVVIDDGSHRFEDQKATLELYWPKLNPGGIYFVEDLEKPFLDFEWFFGGKCGDDGLAWKIKSLC